jgi:hypothetical protein
MTNMDLPSNVIFMSERLNVRHLSNVFSDPQGGFFLGHTSEPLSKTRCLTTATVRHREQPNLCCPFLGCDRICYKLGFRPGMEAEADMARRLPFPQPNFPTLHST